MSYCQRVEDVPKSSSGTAIGNVPDLARPELSLPIYVGVSVHCPGYERSGADVLDVCDDVEGLESALLEQERRADLEPVG